MRPLLIFGAGEESPLVEIEPHHILADGTDAVHAPGVGVQIILDRHIFFGHRRDAKQAGHAFRYAVHVVERESHLDTRFVAASLFARAPGKNADQVRAPLREDVLDGAAEPRPVGQQQHHRGNTPRHSDHRDGGAAPVIQHRLPRLTENVFEHRLWLLARGFLAFSFQPFTALARPRP